MTSPNYLFDELLFVFALDKLAEEPDLEPMDERLALLEVCLFRPTLNGCISFVGALGKFMSWTTGCFLLEPDAFSFSLADAGGLKKRDFIFEFFFLFYS